MQFRPSSLPRSLWNLGFPTRFQFRPGSEVLVWGILSKIIVVIPTIESRISTILIFWIRWVSTKQARAVWRRMHYAYNNSTPSSELTRKLVRGSCGRALASKWRHFFPVRCAPARGQGASSCRGDPGLCLPLQAFFFWRVYCFKGLGCRF